MNTRLTYEDRKEIERLARQGCTRADIARELGRERSTITREVAKGGVAKRSRDISGYSADKAQGATNLYRVDSPAVVVDALLADGIITQEEAEKAKKALMARRRDGDVG